MATASEDVFLIPKRHVGWALAQKLGLVASPLSGIGGAG